MMKTKGYIYALIDPRDNFVRYVGQTKKEPLKRLWMHWIDPTSEVMREWFDSLQFDGVRPNLCILEQPEIADLTAREKFWITGLVSHKMPLLNSIDPSFRAYVQSQEPWIMPMCKALACTPGDILVYTPDDSPNT